LRFRASVGQDTGIEHLVLQSQLQASTPPGVAVLDQLGYGIEQPSVYQVDQVRNLVDPP
jgi:hypothetical protein